jgi:pimeloyl-ACP methyl ester carboxylesterase
METLTLAEGRELTYDTYGDPDGMAVIFSHGIFDSRLIRNPDEQVTASFGLRMIAADQPGVGGSTPLKGRRMVDWGHARRWCPCGVRTRPRSRRRSRARLGDPWGW